MLLLTDKVTVHSCRLTTLPHINKPLFILRHDHSRIILSQLHLESQRCVPYPYSRPSSPFFLLSSQLHPYRSTSPEHHAKAQP